MATIKTISPAKKVKMMKVGEMKGFTADIEAVRKAIAQTNYRFHSEYNQGQLIITRTA